ncbi:hypothetical protein WBJ53_26340 [Spirosoma sp. SC4-14]|uniref:hypothetical protein n=1 Tax=Spirosoma sp. SC4-14 TaxID=3128900 RepID=UPI0030D4DE9D
MIIYTMKYVFLLIILTCIGASSLAQTADSTKKANVTFNPNSRRNGYETYRSTDEIVGDKTGPYGTINKIDHRYEGLKGTPYFLPQWTQGEIDMVNGQHYTDVPIKFDAFRQYLILLRNRAGQDSIVVNSDQVKSFQLNSPTGQTYLFKHLPNLKTDDESLKEGYLLVLYQGETSLFKRITKTFKAADYKDPYSNDVRYDSFKEAASYYLLKPDQSLVKVKLTKKSLLDALDHQSSLKTFVEQHHLALKTENEAIALIKQYNSLTGN